MNIILLEKRDGYTADCDACGKRARLSRVWVTGIETFACAECRGDDEEEEMER